MIEEPLLPHPLLNIIGLMSGTSADGIDAVLLATNGQEIERTGYKIDYPYRLEVKKAIEAARQYPEDFLKDKNRRLALNQDISDDHASAVSALLQNTPKKCPLTCQFIGFHGQTIYHNSKQKQSIQLGDANRLASLSTVPVIYDFRRADLNAGGQGAPLAPIYHQLLFHQAGIKQASAFVNIGGVANLSFCHGDILQGYDIGPGNGLIDDICAREFGQPFDLNGQIAATGNINPHVINHIMADKFFSLSGPRSLDRGHFSPYLADPEFIQLPPADKIATLTALTANIIVNALSQLPIFPRHLFISGGGAHNQTMMRWIKTKCPHTLDIKPAEAIASDTDMMEAELIAVLAARFIYRLASTFPGTTGVHTPQICGVRANP